MLGASTKGRPLANSDVSLEDHQHKHDVQDAEHRGHKVTAARWKAWQPYPDRDSRTAKAAIHVGFSSSLMYPRSKSVGKAITAIHCPICGEPIST